MIKQILLPAMFVATTFYSCQESELGQSNNQVKKSSVDVIDGRVSFANQADFQDLIKKSIDGKNPNLVVENASFRIEIERGNLRLYLTI